MAMDNAENNGTEKKPRTNFGNCLGEAVTLYLRESDQLHALKLPHHDGGLEGRLVGVERQGVWFELDQWREDANSKDEDVPHVFFLWENVLTMVRKVASSEFAEKKQYRGLRPRS